MIKAELQGRRLVLTVETEADEEPIEPFLVSPLPARAGRELSIRYLYQIEGLPIEVGSIEQDFLDAFGVENAERADNTLGMKEGELLIRAAWFWQGMGGIEAVRALLEVDENGDQGSDEAAGKAVGVFRLRMVPLLSQTRHRLELARQTLAESTPATSTPPGGSENENEPGVSPSSEPIPQPQPPTSHAPSAPPSV